jgi:hypothetical protein
MAWMQAMGECARCRALFAFNPNRVPSVAVNGTREPICRTCVETANPERLRRGLPAIVILPGAYEAEEVDG